jgi:tetratricopeptide (TPR) repeat protein
MQLTTAVRIAADSLQLISEATAGARGRGAATVALVLRAVEHVLAGGERGGFLRRRAEREVAELSGAERAHLARLLLLVESPAGAGDGPLCEALVDLAYGLETARRLPEAEAVMEVARAVAPGSAEVALHAGRVARRQRKRERALELYRAARDLDGEGGAIARLARVGEAVVSDDPEAGLGEALRGARAAEDGEAVAVALEERARLRRARGDRRGAGLDLCRAALRYADPVDRARVAHQLADLYVAGDDPHAAREALLLALAVGDASQREHARGRLHAVSRDLGDRVGTRRWRSLRPPPLVSLSARPRVPVERSEAPRLARWRQRITAATG